uniref:Uncharacterized protein n=1 Tax=Arundo donax TaxID=35708 RepID=A0A0A9DPZ5_ARUDO
MIAGLNSKMFGRWFVNFHTVLCSFANCELRSMVLVDRSMLGSDSPSWNFPGKIPAGLDLPSDVADKKLQEEAHKN